MSNRQGRSEAPSVEDQMLRDWASSGIRRMEHHLLVQARFAAYLRSIDKRDPPGGDLETETES